MKRQIVEPDFIGGLGPLTKEEEKALSEYFAKKKAREESSRVRAKRISRPAAAAK